MKHSFHEGTCSLVAALLVLAASASASADRAKVKVFPFGESGVPRSLKDAPSELSRVLARSLHAELGTVPIEDAAGVLECDAGERSCLRKIAAESRVDTIVFGRLHFHDGDGEIELTEFDGTSEKRRTITIMGDDVDALVSSLEDKLVIKPPPPPTVTPPICMRVLPAFSSASR